MKKFRANMRGMEMRLELSLLGAIFVATAMPLVCFHLVSENTFMEQAECTPFQKSSNSSET